MQEYVCADGRMSVNGICLTPNQSGESENNITKDFSKDVKSSFEFDFDKPVEQKSFTKTITDNLDAYDGFVQDNLGISTGISKTVRTGSAIYGATQYGLYGALGPFALPLIAGGAINATQKKKNEIIAKTMKDPQGDINTIDMMTYGIPTAGEEGFNIHNDAGDKNNNNGGNPTGSPGSKGPGGSDAMGSF